MMKRTRFSRAARASLGRLLKRAEYLVDRGHKNHASKTVHPLQFFNCGSDSVETFVVKVVDLYDRYQASRIGKRGGTTTTKLWEEFIYSSDKGDALSPDERQLVKREMVRLFLPGVPVVIGEHEDVATGRCDLHFFASGYTDELVPLVHTTSIYGHGKQNIVLAMERAESEILRLLNLRRERDRHLIGPRKKKLGMMAKNGIKRLGAKLANIWDGQPATLAAALKEIGYKIVETLTKTGKTMKRHKTIHVMREGSAKGRDYNIATLQAVRLEELKAQELKGQELKAQEPKAQEPPKVRRSPQRDDRDGPSI